LNASLVRAPSLFRAGFLVVAGVVVEGVGVREKDDFAPRMTLQDPVGSAHGGIPRGGFERNHHAVPPAGREEVIAVLDQVMLERGAAARPAAESILSACYEPLMNANERE